ncbi:MAG: hypothetical protein POELPBGB_01308 [Bacteroidia bacterium]|nr:hypothetical protein [Bacteroidia bacterium]
MYDIIDKLRSHRKQTPIMQSDIAFLLGFKDTTNVCKFEKGNRSPHLEIILLYNLLFEAPALAYFNAQRNTLKQQVLNKIPDLINLIEKEQISPKSKARIDTLQAAFNKLTDEYQYEYEKN